MADKPKLDNKTRMEIEKKVYDTFDAVDKTGANTEYYKTRFAKMTNDQFYKFLQRRLPFRTHAKLFKEPTMPDIIKGYKVVGQPLFERVKLNYAYKNADGEPVESLECMVVVINNKRMKQILTKKNATALEIDERDKMGRLMNHDKGGTTSDREIEAATVMGFNYTVDEFTGIKADALQAKSQAYNIINTKGMVSAKDVTVAKNDSVSKNLMNVYLIGSNIHSNLIDEDYYTPLTLENRKKKITREG